MRLPNIPARPTSHGETAGRTIAGLASAGVASTSRATTVRLKGLGSPAGRSGLAVAIAVALQVSTLRPVPVRAESAAGTRITGSPSRTRVCEGASGPRMNRRAVRKGDRGIHKIAAEFGVGIDTV